MKLKTLAVIGAMMFLVACGGAEPVDVSIVDNNQIISKENATLNGKAYMREAFGAEGERVVFQSDSTIDANCRYGDGWATGTLTLKNGNSSKIKCQTNGSGKGMNGCMTEDEFSTKDYSKQDNKCDTAITSLKKLGG